MAVLYGFLSFIGIDANATTALAMITGALIPDIDTKKSKIGRVFPMISRRIERRYGHRTVTHSYIIMFAAGIIVTILAYIADLFFLGVGEVKYITIALVFIVGWMTHIILDTMTVQGAKVFYPVSKRKGVFPFRANMQYAYRTKTGAKGDRIIFAISSIIAVVMITINMVGYENIIRGVQKDIRSAVKEYNQMSKEHLVVATTKIRNKITKETTRGTYKVLGAPGKYKLVIVKNDKIYRIGNQYSDYLKTDKIKCKKRQEINLEIKKVQFRNDKLREIREYIPKKRLRVLMNGSIKCEDNTVEKEGKENEYPVIDRRGNNIRFQYARLKDINRYIKREARVKSGAIKLFIYKKEIEEEDNRKVEVINISGNEDNLIEYEINLEFKVSSKDKVKVEENEKIHEGKIIVERTGQEKIEEIKNKIRIEKMERNRDIGKIQNRITEINSKTKEIKKEYNTEKKKKERGIATQGHVRRKKNQLIEIKREKAEIENEKAIIKNKYNNTIESLKNGLKKEREERYIKSKVEGRIKDIGYSLTEDNQYEVKITVAKEGQDTSRYEKENEKNEKWYEVTHVRDGDTFEIIYKGKETAVRLIGVDTPESTRYRTGEIEEFGKKAAKYAKKLLKGKKVRLEFDVQKKGPYKRLLAYVYLKNGKQLNKILVRKGYAKAKTYPPNVKYAEEYKRLQRKARKKNRGLWQYK